MLAKFLGGGYYKGMTAEILQSGDDNNRFWEIVKGDGFPGDREFSVVIGSLATEMAAGNTILYQTRRYMTSKFSSPENNPSDDTAWSCQE